MLPGALCEKMTRDMYLVVYSSKGKLPTKQIELRSFSLCERLVFNRLIIDFIGNFSMSKVHIQYEGVIF